MALKKHFNYKPWTEWPEGLRLHREKDLQPYRVSLQYEIRLFLFMEFKFQEQLKKLKDHAYFKRVQIIGEVPFYPPLDSADVWANQDLFQIDKSGKLLAKAGAPPDSFNSEGQIWGNPLYNWEKMKEVREMENGSKVLIKILSMLYIKISDMCNLSQGIWDILHLK